MTGIHDDEERIEALRSRLYDRGQPPPQRQQERLTDEPVPVATAWSEPPQPKAQPVNPPPEAAPAPVATPMALSRRKRYRRTVLKFGVLAFVATIVLSSLFLLFGNNSISGKNISLTLSGPFTIGGGETLNLQVGITNNNTIPIQSATLIVEYPAGTRSTGDEPRDLFIERIPLELIKTGETVNLPLQVSIYGEENEERTIEASIEYRVEGSNATFTKDAEPLRLKISSAPVALRIEANQKASSGQEAGITLVVASNSQTPLRDILIEAEYPNGYEFVSADPAPFQNQNKWLIRELEPGGEETITVRGIIGGQENDNVVVHFKVGVPQERDSTALATIFSTASTEFLIENPFLGLELTLSNDPDGVIVAERGQVVTGELVITNTLSDTIYDTVVTLLFGGNAVSDPAVSQTDGFYQSSKNTITWDTASKERLEELLPGESVNLTFSFSADDDIVRTPHITLTADARSRRVSESRVPEELRGSIKGEVKIATAPAIATAAAHVDGPLPPEAEETTTYTVTLVVENGGNDLQDSEVTFSLPPYITWQETTSGPGSFSYNRNNRTVTWKAGDIGALARATAIMGVALEPSVSQIGSTPTLINEQTLRGTDGYTGTAIRISNRAVTAELPTDDSSNSGNGRVIE